MAAVELSGVTKRYAAGAAEALSGVDLRVGDGELLTVLGPSGCGKTTLLRVIAGLERPTSGDVRIGGESVNGVAPAKRRVAMVFQGESLYPHLTVRGNLALGLKLRRVPAAEAARRVAAALQRLSLGPLAERMPGALSGGQRQRVAVARALAAEAAVMLLDEPLSHLDTPARHALRHDLRRLHQAVGNTMIYVTHDQGEALSLGDRVAVLRAGAVVQCAAPDEVYDRPATRFVAEFVAPSPISFFAARVANGALEMPGTAARIPVAGFAGPLDVAVRCEDVSLAAPSESGGAASASGHSGDAAGANAAGRWRVAAHIDAIYRNGPEWIAELSSDAGELAARIPRPVWRLGDSVIAEAPLERLHLFDREGQRVAGPGG